MAGIDRIIAVDRIRPSAVNYNRQTEFIYDKLLDSIRTFGFVDPVIVRSGNEDGIFEDGNWEIIGGEHRWRAAQALEMPQIPCRDLGCVKDTTAQRLMIVLNETKGTPDEDALAGLVRTIKETDGMDALDVLPFDMDRLSDLLDAPTATPDLVGDVSLPPSTKEDRKPSKLRPVDVANAIGLEGASQRDMARLVCVFRQWGASRVNQEVPPWKDLILLLQRDLDERYPAPDSDVADEGEDA
jgi:hypothetical protein